MTPTTLGRLLALNLSHVNLKPGTLGLLLGISSAVMTRKTPANSTHGPDNRCERNDNAAAGMEPERSQVVTAGETADRFTAPQPKAAQTVTTTEPVMADAKALVGGQPDPSQSVTLAGHLESAKWLLGALRDEAESLRRRCSEEKAKLGRVPFPLREQLAHCMHWIGELEDAIGEEK